MTIDSFEIGGLASTARINNARFTSIRFGNRSRWACQAFAEEGSLASGLAAFLTGYNEIEKEKERRRRRQKEEEEEEEEEEEIKKAN